MKVELKPMDGIVRYPTLERYMKDLEAKGKPFANMLKGPVSKAMLASFITLMLSGCSGGQTAGVPMEPRYLTEPEASGIFAAEAKKAGITFSTDGEKTIEVKIPDEMVEEGGNGILRITLDGYNAEKNAGFELISFGDEDFAGLDPYSNFNLLAESLNKAGSDEEGAKVYYFAPVDVEYTEQAEDSANVKEEIKAFIDWLKGQGLV